MYSYEGLHEVHALELRPMPLALTTEYLAKTRSKMQLQF